MLENRSKIRPTSTIGDASRDEAERNKPSQPCAGGKKVRCVGPDVD
jgi:hypothetical protein